MFNSVKTKANSWIKVGLTAVFALFLCQLFTPEAKATAPRMMNFQAIVTDPAGKPLRDTVLDLSFKIYDDTLRRYDVRWCRSRCWP